MSNRFYDDGLRYDGLYSRQDDDIAFYTQQAVLAGGEILELACGTGRVAIPLAAAGFRVTGIDVAATMLAVARSEAASTGVEVTWVQGDIRDFTLDRRFGLAFIAVNSICHLLTLADFEACMRCVRRHLLPEGRFVVSVFVPNLEILLRGGDVRSPFGDYAAPDGSGTISLTERHLYAPDTQINHIDIFHELPDGPALVADLEMRMYFPQELDALLKYNGFTFEHKYGTYDGRPFDAQSTQQVVVCRLARGG